MKKNLKYSLLVAVFLGLCYVYPYVFIPFFLIGLYDVMRNDNRSLQLFKKYFLGNGVLTWLTSPLNLLFDIFSLPYLNKGVYKLEDLPPAHQSEIKELIAAIKTENLGAEIEKYTEGLPRAMFFFKWYQKKVDCPIKVQAFEKDFRFIRTIGISAFNVRSSTTSHFGPLRACFRMLYCINDEKEEGVYIQVGDTKNYWKDEKLFIFDDTLLHQSFNESDHPRYCLFVDFVRPGFLTVINDLFVRCIGAVLPSMRGAFYKRWKVITG